MNTKPNTAALDAQGNTLVRPIFVNGEELAGLLLVSGLRVSQWRQRGYLDGCWSRYRGGFRYDLAQSLDCLAQHLAGPLAAKTLHQIKRMKTSIGGTSNPNPSDKHTN